MTSLVNYESSTDEENSDEEKTTLNTNKKRRLFVDITPNKKKAVPKLPSFFSPTLVPKDTNKDHQGRIRGTPAIVNSWATYVYIQIPIKPELEAILNTISQVSDIHIYDEKDLHISLSKCFLFKEHELDGFAKSIQNQLQHINSFKVSFAQLTKFENEDSTRYFLSAEIGYGYNELKKCVEKVDQTAVKYKQPIYYKPPRYHLSFAWSLKSMSIEKALDKINEKLIEDLNYVQYNVNNINIKMGNRLVNIKLK
ncbi:unnamed protein product [Cunninghamella blakesleeana]